MVFESTSAVSLKTALQYRKGWNKNSETVQRLQALMPKTQGGKKGYRLYAPIDLLHFKKTVSVPPAVRYALKKAGFVVTDYLAKKCVKIADVEQKNEFNIGKVIAKDHHAKAAFDNDPQLQNSNSLETLVVLSCHPYDIIGMSTGRSWDKTSCMRLDDGISNVGDKTKQSRHVANDVAEGTIVAYAIRGNDKNIEEPLCRCLLKPMRNAKGETIYQRETRIYGNNVPGFAKTVDAIMAKLNKGSGKGRYRLAKGLYNDGIGPTVDFNEKKSKELNLASLYLAPERLIEFIEKAKKEGRWREIITAIGKIHVVSDMLNKGSDEALQQVANRVKDIPEVVDYMRHTVVNSYNSAHFWRLAELSGAVNVPFTDESLRDMPTKTIYDFAKACPNAVDLLLERLENDKEDSDIRRLSPMSNMLYGVMAFPTDNGFAKHPQFKNDILVAAHALRYAPVFGENGCDFRVHELLERLGVEDYNVEDADLKSICKNFGTLGVGCLILAYPHLFRKIVEDCGYTPQHYWEPFHARRPLKALQRVAKQHPSLNESLGELAETIFSEACTVIGLREGFKPLRDCKDFVEPFVRNFTEKDIADYKAKGDNGELKASTNMQSMLGALATVKPSLIGYYQDVIYKGTVSKFIEFVNNNHTKIAQSGERIRPHTEFISVAAKMAVAFDELGKNKIGLRRLFDFGTEEVTAKSAFAAMSDAGESSKGRLDVTLFEFRTELLDREIDSDALLDLVFNIGGGAYASLPNYVATRNFDKIIKNIRSDESSIGSQINQIRQLFKYRSVEILDRETEISYWMENNHDDKTEPEEMWELAMEAVGPDIEASHNRARSLIEMYESMIDLLGYDDDDAIEFFSGFDEDEVLKHIEYIEELREDLETAKNSIEYELQAAE